LLDTVTLRQGKATLKISSLPLGHDKIHVDYAGSQKFAPSTATIIKSVHANPTNIRPNSHIKEDAADAAASVGRRSLLRRQVARQAAVSTVKPSTSTDESPVDF
jgi:hypothetical protein